jgi:signal transduction histidine kinase
MTRSLRVLYLEHNESDRELVRMALDDKEMAFEFVYATSGAEFAAALDRERFDFFLSEYTRPGDDSVSALALARKKCPDVPYLFVSGTIGEERAVECLKSGAADFVLKERLERLLPAVQRALREAGERARSCVVEETRRRQLEAQLLQAQKMEAIGQLAGGVAHDFNNVLTVVIGYARLLLDRGTLPPDAVELLTQIFTAGTRAANLTRQLLVFSRKQTVNRRVIDLNQVAGEISGMLLRLIGEPIKLELALSPAPCLVDADGGMMEQVLMNLAVNARDAMPRGGVLAIATERITISDAATRRHPGARTGEFACLSMRDTGCGIPPENLERIFEPFFTTKEAGHGTGLGLATVFGIVQQHQGWIELESELGAGTCFRILLPAAPAAAMVPARHPARTVTASGGSETLLVVEDEPAVREFAVAVLRSHGYRVLQAGSGVDALDVWKWHGSRIAVLVTDLVMPDGLGGVELAARLRKEKPALKVVLTSGYESGAIGEAFRPPAGTHFIQKPYRPQVLAQAVRDALDDNYDR